MYVFYCLVCERPIHPRYVRMVINRDGTTDFEIDHEHDYVVYIEHGAVIPLNSKTARLLNTLSKVKYL
jgi:hypothetical protein